MIFKSKTVHFIKSKRQFNHFLLYSILVLYSVLAGYPLIWMLMYSLKTNQEILVTNPFGLPESPQFSNYQRALGEFNIGKFFTNSIFVATVSTVAGIILVFFFTYAITRMRRDSRVLNKALFNYVSIGVFFPVQTILIPLVVLMKDLHLGNTYLALIIPYVALSFPLSTILLFGFLKSIPYDFEESAYLDGAGVFLTSVQIIMPIVKPAIATIIILQFMNHWNEFTLALVLISKEVMKTLPLGLASFSGRMAVEWGPQGAALVIASFPVILLYIFTSDKVEKSLTINGAIKG